VYGHGVHNNLLKAGASIGAQHTLPTQLQEASISRTAHEEEDSRMNSVAAAGLWFEPRLKLLWSHKPRLELA
jgi:hypothetical protein